MRDDGSRVPAAIYARVSSDKQDVDLSISAQLKALRDYAGRDGSQVVREYVDEAESGRSSDRPGFKAMSAAARQSAPPFRVILVWKLSRFALAALAEGHRVNLLLFEDALFAAKKGQSPHEFPGVLDQRMPNCEAPLQAVVRQGTKVKLCGVCASERGVGPDDVHPEAQIAGMRDLVQWV